MAPTSLEEKKRLHELEIQQNVELAKDSSNYCTYLTDISEFDPEITVYTARRIGRSHIKKGKPCQDYCLTKAVNKGHIFVVSDGVSACPRSDKGSQFACQAAIHAVEKIDNDTDDEAAFTKALCSLSFRKLLVSMWLELIKKDVDLTDNKDYASILDVKLYGATLSLAIMTENRIITLNLGDGQILLFNPVDAMRVRWHPPKEDSVTAALCDACCYEDSFIVHNHDRHMYSGILLSTDGIYDKIPKYGSFFAYARQLTERFEASGEPLQPFCFRESNNRQIDLHTNVTFDDCSIVLVVDHHPVPSSTADVFVALKNTCHISELHTRANGLTLYKVTKETTPYLALTQQGDLAQTQKAHEQTAALNLTQATLFVPEYQWEENGFTISLYPNGGYYSPETFFAVGKLKEKAEDKYGLNASQPALQALLALERCDKELREKGFCLNNNARFLTFFTNTGLLLMSEAISPLEKGEDADLLWQLFENQIGTLTCDDLVRPVFSLGFQSAGPNLLNPADASETKLCYIQCNTDGERRLVNAGETMWKFPDDIYVNPEDSVLLTDGLRFKIVDQEHNYPLVTYNERKARI